MLEHDPEKYRDKREAFARRWEVRMKKLINDVENAMSESLAGF